LNAEIVKLHLDTYMDGLQSLRDVFTFVRDEDVNSVNHIWE